MARTRTLYQYDPLDRLIGTARDQSPATLRFYNQQRLATEKQGLQSCSVFQHLDQLLAEQRAEPEAREALLLATDQQRSVLQRTSNTGTQSSAYDAYGHIAQSGLERLLGFNGERPDPVTGHYLLGNGHRAYNPVLMRFNSPDALSPFSAGGLNAYAYCMGDPVNRVDPNGRFAIDGVLVAVLAVTGLAGSINGLVPSIGFYSAFKALKAGGRAKTDMAKVAGAALTLAAGTLGVTRLSMSAAGEESGASEMIYISLGLAILGVGSSIGATTMGWKATRTQAKLNKTNKTNKTNKPLRQISNDSSSGNSSSETASSGLSDTHSEPSLQRFAPQQKTIATQTDQMGRRASTDRVDDFSPVLHKRGNAIRRAKR